jgi:hypothetical protein
MNYDNQFASKLIVEYLDGSTAKAYRLSVMADIHEVSDLLFKSEGKHPMELTIVQSVAMAVYAEPVRLALTSEV